MKDDKKPQVWAAYCRVSTLTQAKKVGPAKQGEKPAVGTQEAQREDITAWAEKNGHRLEWYVDKGVSGKVNQDGPNFQKMLADIEKQDMAGIVTTALDRLGRDAAGLLHLIQELRDHKRELVSLREGDQRLTSALSATDRFTNGMFALLAELTHGLTVERMQAGLRRYVEAGGKIGRHRKPIDWKVLAPFREHGASIRMMAKIVRVSPKTMHDRLRERQAKEKGLAAARQPGKAERPAENSTGNPAQDEKGPQNANGTA